MSHAKTENDGLLLAGERQLERVREVRHRLLELHKAIVDAERIAHERINGRVSAGEFLNVLVSGDDFAWLRPLTALIVQLDELIDAREPTDAVMARVWLDELATLLRPDPSGGDFQRHYAALLQTSPDVAIAHASALRARGG
jgi:hypothetical protein